MLDHVVIFTKGGLVIWSHELARLKGTPIDDLVCNVLLSERGGEESFTVDTVTCRWHTDNVLELIYVIVYQSVLKLPYVDDLLSQLSSYIAPWYTKYRSGGRLPSIEESAEYIDRYFTKAYSDCEASAKEKRSARTHGDDVSSPSPVPKSGASSVGDVPVTDFNNNAPQESNENEKDGGDKLVSVPSGGRSGKPKSAKAGANKKPGSGSTSDNSPATKGETKDGKGKGKSRVWDDAKLSKEDAQALNFGGEVPAPEEEFDDGQDLTQKYGTFNFEFEQPKEEPDAAQPEAKKSSFFSLFSSLTGNKILDEDNLAPVLVKFKDHLICKNVATEISDQLCDSVKAKLLGMNVSTFSTVNGMVKEAVTNALERILTSKGNIDILAGIRAAKAQQKVYSVVFCGVNGVGKSTNLAKNNVKVLIAACDTFRSGAVEQLRVHARRLRVELFERGYNKDAADIAKEAISYAKEKGFECVLVDTAGRMQDNAPLMRSLVKVINVNNPDIIMFVGEALVGNDAVDQLRKFNRSLADYSTLKTPRLIDGILLTKFDTVDEKVGSAISMSYTPPGQPIIFVGTGQHYTDLKKLNVSTVINSLMH